MVLKKLLNSTALTLSAVVMASCGGGSGGSSVPQPPPPPPPPDTTAPAVSFSPATLTVESSSTGASALTATDNVAVTTGPTVDCTNGGAFSGGTFTAPAVTVETTSVCTATAGDAAGNQGTGTLTVTITPPATVFTLQGTASKGMIFGGAVTVTDASNATTVLATGTTNTTDGQFDLDITNASFTGDFVRLVVTGGTGAEMLCDAPAGCNGTAFGSRFAIDNTISLSAIIPTPTAGTTQTVNLNIFTDLTTRIVDNAATISAFEIMVAQDDIRSLFDFNNPVDFTMIDPLDITQASIASTNFEELRAGIIAGGILGSLFEAGADIGGNWNTFGNLFVQNNAQIIANESTDDPALISLEDILENSAALRTASSATDAEFISNLNLIDQEIVTLQNDAEPDELTQGGNLPVAPPPTPPALTFNPSSLTVTSGGTGQSTLTVMTDDTIVSGPDVSCADGGAFANGVFTAPTVTANTTIECTATATDSLGMTGSAFLSVIVTPPDTTAPVVTFNPVSLTVASASVSQVALSATDNVAVTTGPDVTCTNNGSFANNEFTAPTVTANTTVVCTATAMDAAGNSGDATFTATVTAPPASVTIDGKITFDFVPFNTATNGLNYNAITQEPAPGITVEAQSSTGTVLAADVTDVNGDYSFSVDPNTDVRIVAKAELAQTTGAQWDVQVIDNTSSNALYQIAGSSATSGTSDSTRNLNAGSGWGGSSYTTTRAAAPFAILAPIYASMQRFAAVDSDVVFPRVRFNWSVNNRAANGNLANGEIGTSSYRSNGTVGNGNVYVLGDDNADTDEYDKHVIIHEWGHYFEDQLSRSDSIGGSHSGGQRLDPRVAMGEGFGNALSGMMTDDPFYRDSNGNQQSGGFSISVETNRPAGWFDESTVQSVLYDIYDAADDDTLSLGLAPIYEAFTADAYRNQSVFTTIFSFLAELRSQQAGSAAAIDTFAATRGINSTTQDGAGETNNGSTPTALPLYKQVTVNGGAVQVCSNVDNGEYNKLANRAYLKFTATAGAHTLTMTRANGTPSRDPDFLVYKNGALVARAESAPSETETTTVTLTAGEHVIDAYDFLNTGQATAPATTGDACYNFTITR